MNNWNGIGRLTKDPDVRRTQSAEPMAVARYTLAIDRPPKKDGTKETDFINCVAFGKRGEFAEKYLHKGMKIAVTGCIQTGRYEKGGHKFYTTDIVVNEHFFCESKGAQEAQNEPVTHENVPSGFTAIDDDELPF